MPSIVRKSDEDIGGKEQSTSSQLEMNNQSNNIHYIFAAGTGMLPFLDLIN